MVDVLVLGAGLSGLMAAYKTAKSGMTTKVIAKGLGGAAIDRHRAGQRALTQFGEADPQLIHQRVAAELIHLFQREVASPGGHRVRSENEGSAW